MCGSTRDVCSGIIYIFDMAISKNNHAGGWLSLLQKTVQRDKRGFDGSKNPHFHSGHLKVL